MPVYPWISLHVSSYASALMLTLPVSLQYLPIAEATVLTFLSPSLASWACSIFIDEPFTRMEQIAGLIALSGVILIARPSALFSSSSPVPIGTGLSDGLPSTGGSAMNSGQAHISSTKRLTAVGVAMLGVCGTAVGYAPCQPSHNI